MLGIRIIHVPVTPGPPVLNPVNVESTSISGTVRRTPVEPPLEVVALGASVIP